MDKGKLVKICEVIVMVLDEKKLRRLDGQRPEYDRRFDKLSFKSRYQTDIIKGIVEIIKNGVDAYIKEKGEDNCKKEKINVILDSETRKNDVVRIINFAKGMNHEEFNKAMKVGADTSGDKEAVTGAHGYGMKEAAWAFSQATIITIKEEKYSSRIFYWEDGYPKSAWDKDDNDEEIIDRPVYRTVRLITGIENEGTYFEGIIPKDISCPQRSTCHGEIKDNILLRTINQSEKFEISLGEKDNKGKITFYNIQYHMPEILPLREDRQAIDEGEFSFDYPKYGIVNCKYELFLSKTELLHTGDKREAGILICAGPFTVLDCSLFELGGKVAYRFFGRALLTGSIRKICKNEKILEYKREEGLIKKTPLYTNLYNRFHKRLEKLIDKERKRLSRATREISKVIIDNKESLLKEFNKIDKTETEESTNIPGDTKFDPGPDGMRFCVPYDYLQIIEKQKKNVHIVINTDSIPIGSEVSLSTDKKSVEFDPVKFLVTKEETDNDDVFKKKISFKSDIIDSYAVTASIKDMLNKANLNIKVISDQRLRIKKPIEFIPAEQDIVAGKKKEFQLILDGSQIDLNEEIDYETDVHLFAINKKIKLYDSKQIYRNIYELMIPIFCSGRPGQKGELKLIIGSNSANLKLNIIDKRERHLRGDFNGIKDGDELEPDILSYYEDKIIYLYIHHPIFRHYRSNKQGEKGLAYRLLYSDVVIREFCKVLTRKNIKAFGNISAEDFRVRFDRKYERLYKKHAVSLHKLCINPKNLEAMKVD